MALVGDGDRSAFVEIVHRYQQMLLNFFRRMGAYTDEAEDLVQETFLRLFEYRLKYEPTGRFTGLLFTLARHAWADGLRKLRRWPELATEEVERAPASGGSDVERAEARIDLEEALAGLSEKLRPVVVLGVCQGVEQKEIARLLDIPVGTVKSRMHLALGQLREAMRARDERQDG